MNLYAVVGLNQEFGTWADEATLWDNLGDALDNRDDMNLGAKSLDRRVKFQVYELVEVGESHEHEWAVRHTAIDATAVYVNERAARACTRDGDLLLRRRVGTNEWTEVAA